MRIIGIINEKIITLLGLQIEANTPIMIGASNIEHMKNKHPDDYNKYKDEIKNILDNPDYIGCNPSDGSIEYVKEYLIDNEYVKVAVRVSSKNKYYARTIYTLNNNRVINYIAKGTLKPVK